METNFRMKGEYDSGEHVWNINEIEDFIREEGKLPLLSNANSLSRTIHLYDNETVASKEIQCKGHNARVHSEGKRGETQTLSRSPLSPFHALYADESISDDTSKSDDTFDKHPCDSTRFYAPCATQPTYQDESKQTALFPVIGSGAYDHSEKETHFLNWDTLKSQAKEGKIQVGSLLLLRQYESLYHRCQSVPETMMNISLQASHTDLSQQREWSPYARRQGLSNKSSCEGRNKTVKPSRLHKQSEP